MKNAAFIYKDGSIKVLPYPHSEPVHVFVPKILQPNEDELAYVEVVFVRTNEITPCPCCGAELLTYREKVDEKGAVT